MSLVYILNSEGQSSFTKMGEMALERNWQALEILNKSHLRMAASNVYLVEDSYLYQFEGLLNFKSTSAISATFRESNHAGRKESFTSIGFHNLLFSTFRIGGKIRGHWTSFEERDWHSAELDLAIKYLIVPRIMLEIESFGLVSMGSSVNRRPGFRFLVHGELIRSALLSLGFQVDGGNPLDVFIGYRLPLSDEWSLRGNWIPTSEKISLSFLYQFKSIILECGSQYHLTLSASPFVAFDFTF